MLTYSSEKERSVLMCERLIVVSLCNFNVIGSSSAKQHCTSVFILVLKKSSGWNVTLAPMPGVSLIKTGGK